MNKINFRVGDIVRVTSGDVHAQKAPFEGTVIAFGSKGENKNFVVRKVSASGVAIERIYPVNSPHIKTVSVVKPGNVRRSKLFYLRNK